MIVFRACIFCRQKYHQRKSTDHFCGAACLAAWEAKQVSRSKRSQPVREFTPLQSPEDRWFAALLAAVDSITWESIERLFGATFHHIEKER